MWKNPPILVDLFTFTKDMLNGILHFCAVTLVKYIQPKSAIKTLHVDISPKFLLLIFERLAT